MPAIPITRETIEHFCKRLNTIQETDQPLWGTMNPARMVRHLRFATEASLGEVEVEDKSNILSRTIIRWLFFHVLTNWPKGKINVPARYIPEPDGDLEAERDALFAALERFLQTAEREPDRRVIHEFFGPVTLDYYRRIHGVHMNHHLRQFGV